MTVEHHCLDTQYMHLRVHNYGEREKLASSIGKNGQLMPIIMIPSETQHWTLIDGHLRVQALKCLGSDTVTAELWQCDATGICQVSCRLNHKKTFYQIIVCIHAPATLASMLRVSGLQNVPNILFNGQTHFARIKCNHTIMSPISCPSRPTARSTLFC